MLSLNGTLLSSLVGFHLSWLGSFKNTAVSFSEQHDLARTGQKQLHAGALFCFPKYFEDPYRLLTSRSPARHLLRSPGPRQMGTLPHKKTRHVPGAACPRGSPAKGTRLGQVPQSSRLSN